MVLIENTEPRQFYPCVELLLCFSMRNVDVVVAVKTTDSKMIFSSVEQYVTMTNPTPTHFLVSSVAPTQPCYNSQSSAFVVSPTHGLSCFEPAQCL